MIKGSDNGNEMKDENRKIQIWNKQTETQNRGKKVGTLHLLSMFCWYRSSSKLIQTIPILLVILNIVIGIVYVFDKSISIKTWTKDEYYRNKLVGASYGSQWRQRPAGVSILNHNSYPDLRSLFCLLLLDWLIPNL